MADIAQIGFAADTSALKDAKASLDALPPSAAKSERAANKLGITLGKVDASADKLTAAASGLVTAADKLSKVLDAQATAAGRAAAGTGKTEAAARTATVAMTGMTVAASKVSVTFNQIDGAATAAAGALNTTAAAAGRAGVQMDQLDAHVAAYRANLRQMKIDQMAAGQAMGDYSAHVMAYRDHLDTLGSSAKRTGQQIKFTATEGLNASRQLADIGVTAAMGMSPFMIAIQQGPQLFDILQMKALQTGNTIGAVFKAAGVAIWTALAPLLPLILGVAAVAGTIAAGFALGARQINASNKDIVGGLDLTEKQLKKVKKAGVDTTVTMTDTFNAFFQVIGDRLKSAFDGPLKDMKKAFNDSMNDITGFGRWAIKDVVGTFVGGYYAIVALWNNMPKTFSGIGSLVANAFIASFEVLINRMLEQVNGINKKLNEALKAAGIGFQFQMFEPVKLGRVANKEASVAADAIAKGYQEGYAKAGKATDRFFADVSKRAVANRKKAILAAAGDAEKGPKDKKPKAKKEKFDDGIERITPASWDPSVMRDLNVPTTVDLSPFPIKALDDYVARWRAAVEDAKQITKGFVTDLRTNLMNGQNLFSSFANAALAALNKIADKLLDNALNAGLNSLFGGGGIGGAFASLFNTGSSSAAGGIAATASNIGFSGSGITAFAKGDAFANKPTAFAYGAGNIGVMGEAGPEAVMPLQRGPDGSLGVQMYGGRGDTQQVAISVAVEEGALFRPVVRQIADESSSDAMQEGIRQYDAQMPARVQQIASDDRVRG